jgi:hypothetical protein
MQLLIKIFVFIISTQSFAEFFSFKNVRINHDSHILLVYKIAVTRQTTNFFFLRNRNSNTNQHIDQKTSWYCTHRKKNVSKILNANMMINQRNNICKVYKNVIVVEDLNCLSSFETNVVSFWWNNDFDKFFFRKIYVAFVRDWSTFTILIKNFKKHFLFSFFFKRNFLIFSNFFNDRNDTSQTFDFVDVNTAQNKIDRKEFETKTIFSLFFLFFDLDCFDAKFV